MRKRVIFSKNSFLFLISFSISAMGVGEKATSGDWREEEAYRNRRGWLLLLS